MKNESGGLILPSDRAQNAIDSRAELRLFWSDVMDEEASSAVRFAARQLFHEAYEAQLANDYERAIELYQRSIETYPTAEAHTFLGWVYSFQQRYDDAIEECLRAIAVDETLGNPYNDIGSYLLAKGDTYSSERWFKRALLAPRYESYAFPHFNLGRVYETRRRFLEAAKHYGLALDQKPDFTEAAISLRRMQARLN
ncbi:MAG TPA: tetratricopeptide repeat protein [Pyrinomonadaceae bacterium]